MFNHLKKAIVLLIAIMAFGIVSVSSASAMLSNVGPHLSSNPSTAKVQLETMLHHDHGVQAFYAHSSGLSVAEIRSAKVIDLKFGHCRIGVNQKCPFNTGKDGSGNVVKTSFRTGEVRPVAYVEIEIGKALYKVTFESPCVNLLSPLFPVSQPAPPVPHAHLPHIPVSPKLRIVYKLVSISYSVSQSSSSATANCPSGSVSSSANAGALAGATAKLTTKVYIQAAHSWTALNKQISSISTVTYTNTSTGTSVSCTTPPSPPCSCTHGETPVCTTNCTPVCTVNCTPVCTVNCTPPPPLVCPQGSIPNEKGTECVKNGLTTPEPPAEAPGKNPPDEGGVGSNECYSETTGEPVPAREGLCPPGSYGSY